ncbi:hypothetical protein [Candidatus Similichlamydia laticola]|uniref:Uncharacterized protein n=1 Tax=Candidatus Similichlamydia laticola TaxID=2170265 RepID=A0A369KFX4_9BACT|nr:hypothetical protein [Candidatus Similichlamydia laticola]RDB31807.1 hypothetical protein HAT2_00084 [Candidatus Similichlamydia laticola]
MPETVKKVSAQPNADAVQQSVANFSADVRDALEQDQRRSVGDRIAVEKNFQSFGILDTTASESVPNGQVQNVIRQTPAKSVSTLAPNYLAESDVAAVFTALEKVFSSKLIVTGKLSAFNKDALDRYSESMKAKIRQNQVELEAEIDKMTAQQTALHMATVGAAIQLASTLLSVAGSVLNQVLTRPDSTRVQEVRNAPPRFGASRTGREIPADETPGEANVFVPGPDQAEPAPDTRIDTRKPSGQLEITLESEENIDPVSPPIVQQLEEQLEIVLNQDLGPVSPEQQVENNVSELREQVKTTSLDLKDRIQLALSGLQTAGQALGGMVSQIGQAQAAELEAQALETQKNARQATAALDGYIQLIQAAIKGVGKDQKTVLEEAGSIVSIIEDRASTMKEASMRVFRA